MVSEHADVLQVGRAQHAELCPAARRRAKSGDPVLLKRGMMSTIEELLMSAEYILSHGNRHVMLCERGIRTFETYTRNTLDINAVPALKQLSHLPVIVDPSHGTGTLGAGRAGGQGGAGRGRGRPDRRGASAPRAGPFRRRAVAQAGEVRRADARAQTAGAGAGKGPLDGRATRRGASLCARLDLWSTNAQIAIVGLGLIGGSLGLALRERACRQRLWRGPPARADRRGARCAAS